MLPPQFDTIYLGKCKNRYVNISWIAACLWGESSTHLGRQGSGFWVWGLHCMILHAEIDQSRLFRACQEPKAPMAELEAAEAAQHKECNSGWKFSAQICTMIFQSLVTLNVFHILLLYILIYTFTYYIYVEWLHCHATPSAWYHLLGKM